MLLLVFGGICFLMDNSRSQLPLVSGNLDGIKRTIMSLKVN